MDDPWFTYTRGGGRFHVAPRNAKGWIATMVFALLLGAPAVALSSLIEDAPWAIIGYLLFTMLLAVLFIRWAISRSHRIDLEELDREMAEFREWKRRHGRR